jgi:pyruvate dehydrogenase E2 component (dihydrolipoamide acetyltransferase)
MSVPSPPAPPPVTPAPAAAASLAAPASTAVPAAPAASALPAPPAAPAPAPAPAAPAVGARLALFRAGGRLCGVAAAFCKQFVHLEAVTPVPLGPAELIGVTQLRGRILPVLDTASLLGPAPAPQAAAAAPATGGGLPVAGPGMAVLVVTATGLDSTLAALRVTEIVGFEPPTATSSAGGRVLWRGEEVAVLDLGTLLARLRPAAGAGHARRPLEETLQ